MKKAKTHSEAWFERWEQRIAEPYKNTKRYYYRGALLRVLSIVGIPQAFVDAIRCKYYMNKYERQREDYLKRSRAVTLIGEPGAGKTFSASNIAPAVAEVQWKKLQSDYHLQRHLINRWIAQGKIDKVQAFQDLAASYRFFKEREETHIPCLISSIPLADRYGRTSYKLTDEVAMQLVRVPEYSVLFNDESGSSQGSDKSRFIDEAARHFYRYNRHFGDFILINTDPGEDGNGKFIRIVTDYNIHLQRQQPLMEPLFMRRRFEKARDKFLLRLEQGKLSPERAQYIGEKLYYRGEYLKTIGFRRIPYRFESVNGGPPGETGVFIIPGIGELDYNDRAYRLLYKARNKEFGIEGWKSLLAEPEDFPNVQMTQGKQKKGAKGKSAA